MRAITEDHPTPQCFDSSTADPGGLRELLAAHRDEILQIAQEYGASNVRVFGSVARGDHCAQSDVDLLMDLPIRRLLLNVAGLSSRLSDLLGVRVDVTTPRLLRSGVSSVATLDAMPL